MCSAILMLSVMSRLVDFEISLRALRRPVGLFLCFLYPLHLALQYRGYSSVVHEEYCETLACQYSDPSWNAVHL